MSGIKLSDIYGDEAVKEFGTRLRIAVRKFEDYATLTELEDVEEPEELADLIKRFLRRFETFIKQAKRKEGIMMHRPSESQLERLMELAEQDVRLVRAALISYALVKADREEGETGAETD